LIGESLNNEMPDVLVKIDTRWR